MIYIYLYVDNLSYSIKHCVQIQQLQADAFAVASAEAARLTL